MQGIKVMLDKNGFEDYKILRQKIKTEGSFEKLFGNFEIRKIIRQNQKKRSTEKLKINKLGTRVELGVSTIEVFTTHLRHTQQEETQSL